MQWQEFRSHIRHLPTRDISQIERAFELGKKVHASQKRKSGEPYFTHPVAVAHMLADIGADADTLIAALLHDTVEDTPLTLKEIDGQFDGSVATIIDGVTKLNASDVAASPKLDEQTETLRKIFTLMQQDVRIMVIKLVDRLHNMQTAEFLAPERQKTLAKETLEVYVKIADKLCMQDLRDELEALCLAILDAETYAQLTEIRSRNELRGNDIIEAIRHQLRTHDRHLASRTLSHFECKTWEQLRSQMQMGGSVATGLSSITTVFVCEDVDHCYRILGALHQLWKREVMSFQDFINAPQINGYQGLHTTIIVGDGTRVRCKIRTREMQEYARQGIATKCFDPKAQGIAEYLPWTQRITPLTSDTEGSSNDFWQSLQSDILGESIVIHGPDDQTVQLPREATVLDGAFYLLQEDALRTQSIKMNGTDVPFSRTLTNAASLDVTLSDRATWDRDWLRQVRTGFAAAKIRTALAQQSHKNKLSIGREMLQQVLTERKRGFIEEFQEQTLASQLELLGYRSLDDVYVSIADGRLEPSDVYRALFERPEKKNPAKAHVSIVIYAVDMENVDTMDRINLVHRSHGQSLEDIHYHRLGNGRSRVTLRVRMDTHILNSFQQSLTTAGAERVQLRHLPRTKHLIFIAALVLIWGLDPIFAKLVLSQHISTSLFTFIRAWTVFLFALMLLIMLNRGRQTLVRIPLNHPSLWIAGISLFLMNLLTYIFLSNGSPLLYNTLLRANAVIITFPLIANPRWWRSVIMSTALGIAGIVLIVTGPFTARDLLLMTGIVVIFNVYTRATGRFQSIARIQARYIQLFATISFISALSSLILFPLGQISLPDNPGAIGLAAAYAMVFVGLPYLIFHAITDDFGYATLSPWLNAMVLVTLIAQIGILHDTTGFTYLIPAGVLLSIASLLASRIRRTAD